MTGLLLDATTIKWRCRRGMLELDIFLIPFCENIYPILNDARKKTFIILLEENDVDLFDWLMLRAQPDDSNFNEIIKLIRAYRLAQ